jgi:hypothetical protein
MTSDPLSRLPQSMRFAVRHVSGQGVAVVFLRENLTVFCHLQVPRDTVNAWLGGLLKKWEAREAAAYITLLQDVLAILAIDFTTFEAWQRGVFFRFLHALYLFCQRPETSEIRERAEAGQALGERLDTLFNIQAEISVDSLRFGVIAEGRTLFDLTMEPHPLCVPRQVWTAALKTVPADDIKVLLESDPHFALLDQRPAQSPQPDDKRDFRRRSFLPSRRRSWRWPSNTLV